LRRRARPPAPSIQKLPSSLSSLADVETAKNPRDQAGNTLFERRPIFLLFDDDQRNLRSFYSWDEDLSDNSALANLLALADVAFDDLRTFAVDSERTDELQTAEYQANETLEKEFEAWHQSDLSVALRAQPGGLEIHVRDRETKKHTRLEERSAGLRSFVALIAFCATHSGGQIPILLIDEAENHLHYEGQANLLKVFERQSVAQSVIYTTHSIGCLPEDLGTSIRVVAPTSNYVSEVRNSFWAGAAVGLTPLMLAMGATAMAFTPSRNAVIGEGKTEAILLPTLLREGRGGDPYQHLGYQVVPGLAEVPSDDVPELEADAGEVVFLIDSDGGGKSHAKSKLSERAERDGRVFELGDGQVPGLCIEDLVRGDLFVAAFNEVLSETRPACNDRLALETLPEVSRSSFIEKWCKNGNWSPSASPGWRRRSSTSPDRKTKRFLRLVVRQPFGI
jgi:predicted ATP-dependent endonuclease of OLD family